MTRLPRTAFAFLLLLLHSGQGQVDELPPAVVAFIESQESLVIETAFNASQLHARRIQLVRECQCSKHGCSDDFDDALCSTSFGIPDFCSREGRRLDNSSTIFLTPPDSDPGNLNNNLKESICVYQHLLDGFLPRGESENGWIYIGTRDGHTRFFPAAPAPRQSTSGDTTIGRCAQYDPRTRPWYVAASTGPKDVVLVVDKSGSMSDLIGINGRTKWDITQEAVRNILNTFTYADFINVVTFSTEASTLWTESELARGRRENLRQIEYRFSREHPSGNTHFRPALEEAFRLLTDGCDREASCSDCQKIILFLTDGEDTSLKNSASIKPSNMLAVAETLQNKLEQKSGSRASIFTYSMSHLADDAIPRLLACYNDGAWSFIGKDTNALDALNSYYLYVASGRGQPPIWIEPYEDSLGLGTVTTVAVPFYAAGTDEIPEVFLGVAGHDVRFHELQTDGATVDQVLNAIISRSQSCTRFRTSPCELQVFRNAYDNRSLCIDPLSMDAANATGEACYAFRAQFYKRFSTPVSQDVAAELCRQDGGELVEISDDTELTFLARMASVDGSWVAATRNLQGDFEWPNASSDNLGLDSPFWGIGEPDRGEGDHNCVLIDSRGTIGNLFARSCAQSYSFLCEYENDDACNQGVSEQSEEDTSRFPPLNRCKVEEILDETRPIDDVKLLTDDQVVCDLGNTYRKRDILCCGTDGGDDDDSDTATIIGATVSAVILAAVVLAIWFACRVLN